MNCAGFICLFLKFILTAITEIDIGKNTLNIFTIMKNTEGFLPTRVGEKLWIFIIIIYYYGEGWVWMI